MHDNDRPTVVRYVTEYAEQVDSDVTPDTEQAELVIPQDLSELSADEVRELHAKAIETFDSVYADGQNFTEEDLNVLTELTTGIEALQAELAKREEEAAALAAKASELAAKVKGEPAPDASGDQENPVEDAAPVEEPDAVVAAAEPAPAPAPQVRINLSSSRTRQVPKREVMPKAAPATMRDVVRASGDGSVFAAGTGVDWEQIGKIVSHRLSGFNRATYDAAARQGVHRRQQFGVVTIQKPIADDMVINSSDPLHVEAVLRKAMDEKRLQGGSLLASGGWCAPSETLYDLCELESRDGIFSLPEVGIARGGISRTLGPNFADLYNNIGFTYTEAEDIAGDYDGNGGGSKPCYRVECPDFEEIRLGIAGLCISSGLLQQRAYPELLSRTTRGALVAHDHKMASNVINAVAAGSTAVTMGAAVGATAPVLSAIELQSEHIRYSNRMSRNATIEGVFPYWVRGAIRSDLSNRLGVDLFDVSDARIAGWFSDRGIAPQFVYNWQDINLESAAGFTGWPNTASFLLYPAGTWVRGTSDIITMDTIYDSTLLAVNDFLALFTEEGWLVAKMCHDSRVVNVPINPNGNAHAGSQIASTTINLTDATNVNPLFTTTTTTTVP